MSLILTNKANCTEVHESIHRARGGGGVGEDGVVNIQETKRNKSNMAKNKYYLCKFNFLKFD